ncbi:MAG: type I DNA topoisomerase [Gemmatimonadota bacterium]
MSAAKSLVIVESPAKARTLAGYLGPAFDVRASVGHVRDLPERELGVDVEAGFEPKYVTIRGKGKVLRELSRSAAQAERVLLATDPDREGEAIAYHVAQQLGHQPGDGDRFGRIRFNEITKDAVRRALDRPGRLDMRKVEAQQARRILDRLVGFQVSPLLWKPIRGGLSAGRVQTVALRLVVEREDEVRSFEPREYWSITARLHADGRDFEAKLHRIDGKKFTLADEAAARAVLDALAGVPFTVAAVKRRERSKNPPPPFTTSTLQQEASKRLGFNARTTMRVAQRLYEGVDVGGGAAGLITYMRTDSTRVAGSAAGVARTFLEKRFGSAYVPGRPRLWSGRQQKGAQEAHEAIRPTDPTRTPQVVKRFLKRDEHRLYELIWLRFMAGQMKPAVYDTTTIDFDLEGDGRRYLFRATGSVMRFDGFTRLYREAREEGDRRSLDDLVPLPELEPGRAADVKGLEPKQHFTEPPSRYTEASLVKELEKQGIGRPSTYAQIISTLRDRKYVVMDRKRFVPTPLGETVARVLIRIFPDLFDVRFTSEMEEELDRIEEGELEWRAVLGEFYGPFREQLEAGEAGAADIIRSLLELQDEECPECGGVLIVRWNRYGRFVGCTTYPDCTYTRSLDDSGRPAPEETGERCPECGGNLLKRTGRYGPFIGCDHHPACTFTKPVTIQGLICPECGEGAVGEKRTRKGKSFWGCTRYPDCDWSVWDRPAPVPCPTCGAPYLLEKRTRKRGDFYTCVECRSEMSPETVAAESGTSGGSGKSATTEAAEG